MISEREKLEFESLPEFVREPRASSRDSYVSKSSTYIEESDTPLPKSAELEVLWPGVNQEFLNTTRTGPRLYLGVGFAAGVISSLLAVWAIGAIGHMMSTPQQAKKIVVSTGQPSASSRSNVSTETGTGSGAVVTAVAPSNPEVVVPIASSYEVGNGDTLAGIAYKMYKRATPRLLDEICRANNMANANVLSLGQKLVLPDYRPARQTASSAAAIPQ